MHRLGMALLVGGAAVGAAVGVALLTGFHLAVPWLVAVGLAKLTLIASGGLMAAGAVCLRLDRRDVERRRLDRPADDATSDD